MAVSDSNSCAGNGFLYNMVRLLLARWLKSVRQEMLSGCQTGTFTGELKGILEGLVLVEIREVP